MNNIWVYEMAYHSVSNQSILFCMCIRLMLTYSNFGEQCRMEDGLGRNMEIWSWSSTSWKILRCGGRRKIPDRTKIRQTYSTCPRTDLTFVRKLNALWQWSLRIGWSCLLVYVRIFVRSGAGEKEAVDVKFSSRQDFADEQPRGFLGISQNKIQTFKI